MKRRDTSAAAPHLFERLLDGYHPPEGHYDELLDAERRPRASWEAFGRHARELSTHGLATAQARVIRQIHESSLTHAVYAAPDGRARPWTLDVLPLIVSADEWASLADGVAQLARLLNRVVADLYGPQTLVREGIVPPALVFRHPGFLRACHGVVPPGGIHLQNIACDVARLPDGRWQIVNVRTQTPAGAGFALENRATILRMFPDAFRELHVGPVSPYFSTLHATLMRTAPCDEATPRIALLTPGPYSGRYFEHAYLARYFGCVLVEGADLTVRHDRVFLKTIAGLQPVHAILRHLADDYCDPLELRADSALGVPGLLQAWRAGRVLVSNAFGSGVLESPAMRGLLPAMAARLLGEPLLTSILPAWWGGDRAGTAAAIDADAACSVRSAFPDATIADGVYRDGAALAARMAAEPDAQSCVLEQVPSPSYAPVWHDARIESRPLLLRVFAAADGAGGYTVMAGGLTRIAGPRQQAVTSGSGGSKDTWILSATPLDVRPPDPPPTPPPVADASIAEGAVSSRAAEHLFWLGRYVERAESSARLARTALTGLADPSTPDVLRPGFFRMCLVNGLVDASEMEEIEDMPAAAVSRRLIDNLFDGAARQSLAFNVRQTVRVAGAIRDRLSADNWRLLDQLFALAAPRSAGRTDLHEALALLDRSIVSLVAVAGLEMAHMSRNHGWRFLSVGRHLERMLSIAGTFASLTPDPPEPVLLEWLLDASDSLGTFRTRFVRQPEWTGVADLLLFDEYNPRSLAFQIGKIAKHVPQLPGARSLEVLTDLARLQRACQGGHATQADLFGGTPPADSLLADCERVGQRLSDALTSRYFSHAYELSQVTGAGR